MASTLTTEQVDLIVGNIRSQMTAGNRELARQMELALYRLVLTHISRSRAADEETIEITARALQARRLVGNL